MTGSRLTRFANKKFKRTPMFAISQDCDNLTKKQAWKAAGGTHVNVQLGWDVAQASAGANVATYDADVIRAHFADAATAGLRVIYEPACQYTPAWIQTGVPKFKNQGGTQYTGGIGEDVRDWVWSETGRAYLMDFYTKSLAFLSTAEIAQIDTIRAGWGYFGECSFPPVGSAPQSWWGFSAPAQTGTGLATDQVICPNPGYTPFATAPVGTPATANDLVWVAWFIQATVVRTRSIVDKYRAIGYTGNIHMLHPSTGLRSNWATSDDRYRDQNAKGCDWGAQMISYMQVDRTYGWCTWASQGDWNTPVVNDDDKSPTRKLAELATALGRSSFIWGGNAAGATTSDLDIMFEATGPMYGGNASGLMWVDWGSLAAGGPDATLAQLAAKISAYTT